MSRQHQPSGRIAVHELEPQLRDRLLSLDEPVARPDWGDVRSRSGRVRPRSLRRTAARASLAAAIVCVADIAEAPAMGIRLGNVVDFWAAPAAPRSAESTFTRDAPWTRGLPRELELAKTRRIAVDAFRGETMRLFVAPLAGGGFCYEWATEPGDPGSWADELGGCSLRSGPLSLGYDDTRVSIVADPALADGVSVTLSDGQVVKPGLRWVSAPVSAGFLLYQPPSGLHVVEVDALRRGDVVERYPVGQQKLSLHLR
jgi:hypothetical protein